MEKIFDWLIDHNVLYVGVIAGVILIAVGSWFFGGWTYWKMSEPYALTMMCETFEPSAFIDPSICEDR
jgi:hypothetical protein